MTSLHLDPIHLEATGCQSLCDPLRPSTQHHPSWRVQLQPNPPVVHMDQQRCTRKLPPPQFEPDRPAASVSRPRDPTHECREEVL